MTLDDFKNDVIPDTENVWAVAFTIPTCHSCHELAPEWGKLQKAQTIGLRKIKFGYVNLDEDDSENILENYSGDIEVEFTPTILVYGPDKAKPIEYDGDYSFEDMNRKFCGYCDKHGFKHPGARPFDPPKKQKQELQGGDDDPEDVKILRAIGELALSGRFDGFEATIKGFHGRSDNNMWRP